MCHGMEILDRMPWAAQNAVFQRLAEVAEVSKLSKEERLEYDHALKRYRDTLNAMTQALSRKAGLKGERKVVPRVVPMPFVIMP